MKNGYMSNKRKHIKQVQNYCHLGNKITEDSRSKLELN